ncbi:hypothetical protein HDV02_000904 [Globomyces sp. JEL0801]|nr:hypothetical protein HDV02_000904 [Globomyces sp. JEL0801]
MSEHIPLGDAVPQNESQPMVSLFLADEGRPIDTSHQPMFPSIYAYREGNAGLLGLLGFFIAVFPNSLLELFLPTAHQQPIFLYFLAFGGLLQIFAGIKDLHHGNSLAACIFMVFGFHWTAKSLVEGDIALLQPVKPHESLDPSIFGIYMLTLTIVNFSFAAVAWANPHGSLLLVVTLLSVGIKLIFATIHAWVPSTPFIQVAGFFGVLGSSLALYAYLAEALAEEGIVFPTGKFGQGVVSRKTVKHHHEHKLKTQ